MSFRLVSFIIMPQKKYHFIVFGMNMNLVFFTFHIIVITQNAIAQYCYISLQKAKLMIAHNNGVLGYKYQVGLYG